MPKIEYINEINAAIEENKRNSETKEEKEAREKLLRSLLVDDTWWKYRINWRLGQIDRIEWRDFHLLRVEVEEVADKIYKVEILPRVTFASAFIKKWTTYLKERTIVRAFTYFKSTSIYRLCCTGYKVYCKVYKIYYKISRFIFDIFYWFFMIFVVPNLIIAASIVAFWFLEYFLRVAYNLKVHTFLWTTLTVDNSKLLISYVKTYLREMLEHLIGYLKDWVYAVWEWFCTILFTYAIPITCWMLIITAVFVVICACLLFFAFADSHYLWGLLNDIWDKIHFILDYLHLLDHPGGWATVWLYFCLLSYNYWTKKHDETQHFIKWGILASSLAAGGIYMMVFIRWFF